MKQPQILVLLLFLCAFANAQEFAIGIKGGINNNSIGDIITVGSNGANGPVAGLNFEPVKEIGYQFGAFLNIEFGKLYIRPEINYVDLNNSYKFPKTDSEWLTNKIDVPILIGYKIFKPVSIYVGPGFNFYDEVILHGANNTDGESTIDYYKSTTTLNFGVNVEFKRFGVDLRYEMANKETLEERQDFHNSVYGVNQADIFAYKPSQISLSLNIFLFRTNGEDISDIFSNLFRGNSCDCLGN